jgi:hypothetical protein
VTACTAAPCSSYAVARRASITHALHGPPLLQPAGLCAAWCHACGFAVLCALLRPGFSWAAYIDILNLLQANALYRLRELEKGTDSHGLTSAEVQAVLDVVLVTLNGVAAGMRNTG